MVMRNLKLVLLLTCLFSSVAFADDVLSVKQLQSDPKRYDGKQITIRGSLDKFEQRTSRAGNAYFLFKLLDKSDKTAVVNVFGRGKLEKLPKHGSLFEVKGIYRVAKKLGNRVYKNEIETKPEHVTVSKL
jgi:hypothetical protein